MPKKTFTPEQIVAKLRNFFVNRFLPGVHREVICWLIQSWTTRSGRAE